MYDILDDTSRPGYVKVKIKKTGKELWVGIMDTSDRPGVERSRITAEQAKALGWFSKKNKSWDELTSEEKKLFPNNDTEQNKLSDTE